MIILTKPKTKQLIHKGQSKIHQKFNHQDNNLFKNQIKTVKFHPINKNKLILNSLPFCKNINLAQIFTNKIRILLILFNTNNKIKKK